MWGPGAQGGFQNALAMGMQMGAQARQNRERREYKNALSQYDPSNPETIRPIAMANPGVGLPLMQQAHAAQAAAEDERVLSELRFRYLDGDEAAGDELARRSFDDFMRIDTRQRAEVKRESEVFANAAMDILNVPPGEQRRARIITYAQQFPQYAEKINEIAFMPPAEQETALRAVIADAGLIGKLHDMEAPRYQALVPGGTLVNTRDPSAVSQFGAGGFSEGQTATNPQTGQRIIYSNGQWRPM